MIIVDSSAWVEYLRKTGSPVNRLLTQLIRDEEEIGLTEVVCYELLAGARDDRQWEQLRALTRRYPVFSLHGLESFEDAAALYLACSRSGKTVRSSADCLIAIVCIENNIKLLHNDKDFDVLAESTDLEVVNVRSN